MKKHITMLIIAAGLLIPLFENCPLMAEENSEDIHIVNTLVNELKSGSLYGAIGIYHEHVDNKKDNFVEDGEIIDLNDTDLIVPFFQVNYTTAQYSDFSIGAGLTGYTHIVDDSNSDDSIEDGADIVVHKLYLGYEISRTSVKIGRQDLEETLFLSDYYEALSLASEEIKNLFLILAIVDKVAESDIDKFIEFQNINRGDQSIDDYLYAAEITWTAVPEAVSATVYYYQQDRLYDLYGAHTEFMYETGKIGFGLHMDAYATDEDSRNGLRDSEDEVKDSDIYHINPFIEMSDFTLAGGYMEAGHDVGAREGGLIDDYFNPFNEGDKVYEPDAETWYGAMSYEFDDFYGEVVYGRTDYISEGASLTEEEVNLNAGLKFLDHFRLEVEFSIVDSESAEGDFNILEMELTYAF